MRLFEQFGLGASTAETGRGEGDGDVFGDSTDFA